MENLAGVKNADETILEELYLAGIPAVKVERSTGEVPYSYIGKVGDWTFRRLWYYWSASVEERIKGLPFDVAMALHNRKHPVSEITGSNKKLGGIIRTGGYAGGISPDEYGAQPVYDKEYEEQLEKLGYKKEYHQFAPNGTFSLNVGEISKLCSEGKLTVKRYVDCYHIDEQIGLNEFVKTIRSGSH